VNEIEYTWNLFPFAWALIESLWPSPPGKIPPHSLGLGIFFTEKLLKKIREKSHD